MDVIGRGAPGAGKFPSHEVPFKIVRKGNRVVQGESGGFSRAIEGMGPVGIYGIHPVIVTRVQRQAIVHAGGRGLISEIGNKG